MNKAFVKGLAILILVWPVAGFGQDEEIEDEFALLEEEISVDEVESASKHRQPIMWSPSAITVLTSDDIRASGATSLPELLRRVPGMDIIRVKSSYSLVGARAMTDEFNNLVLLLVDGREELLELTGFAFWNALSFDLEEIERVEVIRGPGSALYGANAFTAVVNVTTVKERPTGGADLYLSGAEHGRRRLYARLRNHHRLGSGQLSYSLGVGNEEELSPSDLRETSLGAIRSHGYLRYQLPGQLDISLHGGLVTGEAMLYLYMGDVDLTYLFVPWVMAKSELTLGDSTRLAVQFYYSSYETEMETRADLRAYGVWLADIPDMTWDSYTMDSQLQLETQFTEDLLFIAGANLRHSTLAGKNLILDDDDELRGAGFVHLQWSPAETLQLTGGMRLDLNELTGLAPSPRLVVVYRPVPEHSFRLGYGLAFRKPAFFESRFHLNVVDYNPSVPEIVDLMATQLGNEELENEKVHTLEAGFRSHLLDNRLKISVDLFFNRYLDIMHQVSEVPETSFGLPDLPRSEVRFLSVGGDLTTLGGEASATISPAESWYLWCNLGLRYLTGGNPKHALTDEPLVKLNLGARFMPESGLFADLAMHFVSDYTQRNVEPADLLAKSVITWMGEQLLLVGRLGYRVEAFDADWDIGLTVRAPLTENRREFPGELMPLWLSPEHFSDFGGELFERQVSAYLRASF